MRVFFAAACVLSGLAWGAESPTQVSVMVEVVHASKEGSGVDPASLETMKAKLAPKAQYTSLRRLSLEKVTTPAKLKLPNGKVATITLEDLKDGVARLRVAVPPMSTVYTLGREGTLYQAAGKQGEADLWLLLSAAK